MNSTRLRRLLGSTWLRRLVFPLLGALVGGWLGLALGGHTTAEIGPVRARVAVQPSFSGQTRIDVAPLGSLQLATHRGPLRLVVDVRRLNEQDVRRILADPKEIQDLGAIVHAVRQAVTTAAIQGFLSALAGALLVSLGLFRRFGTALAGAGVLIVLFLGSVGIAALTWNPKAIDEPRYTGLLSAAPSVIGSAENIVSRFESYRRELAKLVVNVTHLYDVTSALPTYEPPTDTVRVLDVSDIHDNPAAWSVITSLVGQFRVNVIVDSGDLTDHGSAPENVVADNISRLGVPYVFVRGNHDSQDTQAAVARQPNAVVLTGSPVDVGGLRLLGDGDPRFTPDLAVKVPGEDAVRAMGSRLADVAASARPPPDVAVVHDPAAAPPLEGTVPLVLAGHTHRRSATMLPHDTLLFVQGSTGGAGLRALESSPPTPMECSILYLDRTSRRLQAYDDITLGGLGSTSVQISRHLAPPAPT